MIPDFSCSSIRGVQCSFFLNNLDLISGIKYDLLLTHTTSDAVIRSPLGDIQIHLRALYIHVLGVIGARSIQPIITTLSTAKLVHFTGILLRFAHTSGVTCPPPPGSVDSPINLWTGWGRHPTRSRSWQPLVYLELAATVAKVHFCVLFPQTKYPVGWSSASTGLLCRDCILCVPITPIWIYAPFQWIYFFFSNRSKYRPIES